MYPPAILTRAVLEALEERDLAPYAVRASRSRGRVYPEDEPSYRTAFQRDRDRILHTTAFRRLEYKTQVFVNHEGDYYRTRLTHTLEVAQIGRTLARALGANEDLVEVICLAHDLGHPPFGHSGERTLDRLMQGHGGFDHNRQTLRIVTELERRYPGFPGLNLTWEVREGIVKHETDYDVADARDYDPELRGTLEAQITNAADELAWMAHDLDDGLRSGMLVPVQLTGVALWDEINRSLGRDTALPDLDDLTRHRLVRRLIGLEMADLLRVSGELLAQARPDSLAALQRLDRDVITFSAARLDANRQFKAYLYDNLYRHVRVVRASVKYDRLLSDLFAAFMEEPGVLPVHIRTALDETGAERGVCDYVAGMTDRFAIQEHRRLFDPEIRV